MPELAGFQQTQYAFSAYIRDPKANPAPSDVELRRMTIYRELFFNNIEDVLANTFPVLKSIVSELQWMNLVQDFFATTRCETPYFSEIPEEFLGYLQSQPTRLERWPNFILELAHYEWMEMLAALVDADCPLNQAIDNAELAVTQLTLSPTAYALAYQFPVHQISERYQPDIAPEQPTLLIVYRDQEDEVKFIEINPVTYRLLELIKNDPEQRCHHHLEQISQEIPQLDSQQVIAGGVQTLNGLLERGVLTVFANNAGSQSVSISTV